MQVTVTVGDTVFEVTTHEAKNMVTLKINGQTVEVTYSSGSGYVSVAVPTGVTDTAILDTIARRFDSALATGKYDALFIR